LVGDIPICKKQRNINGNNKGGGRRWWFRGPKEKGGFGEETQVPFALLKENPTKEQTCFVLRSRNRFGGGLAHGGEKTPKNNFDREPTTHGAHPPQHNKTRKGMIGPRGTQTK